MDDLVGKGGGWGCHVQPPLFVHLLRRFYCYELMGHAFFFGGGRRLMPSLNDIVLWKGGDCQGIIRVPGAGCGVPEKQGVGCRVSGAGKDRARGRRKDGHIGRTTTVSG
jgi:hypothetical protein